MLPGWRGFPASASAFGQRVETNVGGTKTEYIYGIDGHVVAELDGSGSWQTGYVYMGNQLLAEYANGTTYFIHADHLGSTRLRTTVSGTVYDSFDYLPYGEVLSGINDYVPKFTGDALDNETGLDHTLFRQHSSSLGLPAGALAQEGRWMSPDPLAGDISDPQSLNRYAYVGNNPLGYIDPLGADAEIITPGAGHPCTYDAFQGVDACGEMCARGNDSCNEASSGGISFSVGFGLTGSDGGPFGEVGGIPPGVAIPPFSWLPSLPKQCDFGPCYGSSWGQEKGTGYEDEHGNQCTPSVLDDLTGRTCKRPTCIGVFARAGGQIGDKIASVLPNVPGSNPEDLIKEGGTALAITHTIANGLVVPLRSSIVRNLLIGAAEWATVVAAVPVAIQEGAGVYAEAKAWAKGGCRSIWQSK